MVISYHQKPLRGTKGSFMIVFDRVWIISSLNIRIRKVENKIHHLMDFHRAAVDNQ